ncbi:hypothetical protein SPMU_33800 [Sphingomonas mucosissima]|uniref:DUF5681 domain-containing protein n=2 Tax=Sphingomonas mucosissima TaxID=370959 RepID=A0A245ZD68_9SPHN|nr:hypothetical protein SPMU_33800 [Sphingomonas mucosissima]
MPIVPTSRPHTSASPSSVPISRPEIQPRARIRRPVPAVLQSVESSSNAIAVTPVEPGKGEYEVGYKKPPKHSQFKKGQSGNRKGRPKGAKGLNTIVRNIYTKKVTVRGASGSERMSKMEAIVHKTVEKSFSGDMRAIDKSLKLYAQCVPDEPIAVAAPVESASTADMDAHDKAILAAYRRTAREEDDE